jgi:integrase
VLFLLDTGARASEGCGLHPGDRDLQNFRCTVLGKGNKHRTLCFSGTTRKALWQYLKEEPRDADPPLFLGDRGERSAEALTRSGLRQFVERLGKVARAQGFGARHIRSGTPWRSSTSAPAGTSAA